MDSMSKVMKSFIYRGCLNQVTSTGRIYRIWCTFIARRYASAVYAIVVCPSVRCGCSELATE